MRWLTIATYFTLSEAHLARSRLEAEGIQCALADEHVLGLEVRGSPVGVRLRVLEDDAERALAILEPERQGGA